jgi:acyl-CoA thioesterase FadM
MAASATLPTARPGARCRDGGYRAVAARPSAVRSAVCRGRSRTPTTTAAAATTPTPSADGDDRPFHWTTIPVRDYELDAFGVVNNAVYAQYCEHARHEFLAGATAGRLAAVGAGTTAGSAALALSDFSIKFIAPLRSGDVCRAGVRVARSTPARLVCEQRVELVSAGPATRGGGGGLAPGAPIVAATATVVSLDAAYKPRRIPAAVREALAGWGRGDGGGESGENGGGALSWDSD